MAEPYFDFEAEAGELLKRAVADFASFAAEHWAITPDEAELLTMPTTDPSAYARGYNDAIASIPDAAKVWAEGEL